MSVSQAKSVFVRGANTEIKMNGAIVGDSETGRNKLTARQWSTLIGFCGVENREQVQNIWKKIDKSCDATEVSTILVATIKDQQVGVERKSSRVWFGENVAEDIWKNRFTYGPIANMSKTEQGISIMVFIRWNAQEIWEMEEAGL